ncbi:MAG: hypothetical protein K2K29_05965 [Muribaculaceae bacterium]|nr:hypothetical protein [Muribaculaceae bacterium]
MPKKPEKTPYQRAIDDLKRLKARKLWESGREKEYYTELTEILRTYLDGRFGIQAMEMTSGEIMSHLADLGDHDIPRDKMRDVLDMADFVKFAMVRPLPDDNVALFKDAVEFVESTKPLDNSEINVSARIGNKVPEDGKQKGDSKVGSSAPAGGRYKGVGRRGRMARLDETPDRISAKRLKVGKKINRRESSSGNNSAKPDSNGNERKEVMK